MKSTYNVKAQYNAKLLLIAPLSHMRLMFQISNIVISIIAANIANVTIQAIVSLPINQLTKQRIPDPINKPIAIIHKGCKFPLVNKAINDMIKNMPEVMPNANPNILQSTKRVNQDNTTPIKTQ